jgi:tetratricopeptide (TPR) repeat protein
MMGGRIHSLFRGFALITLAVLMVMSLRVIDEGEETKNRQEHLYFPSGTFLKEASLGFRSAAADYLWFRFIQYYGAHAKGENDLRYFDVLIDGINQLDPRFVEAYYFASLVRWSSLGDIPGAVDILKRGILANPDNAKLPFQIGFMYYVLEHDYDRAAHWFQMAGRCSDATDKETRFAAFAKFKSGDDRVSLALWKDLLETTDSPQMKGLAEKMINQLITGIKIQKLYGDNFIGPIPEL